MWHYASCANGLLPRNEKCLMAMSEIKKQQETAVEQMRGVRDQLNPS
jgi:hypothetical protein